MSDNDDIWMFFIIMTAFLTGILVGSIATEPQNPACAPTQLTTQ